MIQVGAFAIGPIVEAGVWAINGVRVFLTSAAALVASMTLTGDSVNQIPDTAFSDDGTFSIGQEANGTFTIHHYGSDGSVISTSYGDTFDSLTDEQRELVSKLPGRPAEPVDVPLSTADTGASEPNPDLDPNAGGGFQQSDIETPVGVFDQADPFPIIMENSSIDDNSDVPNLTERGTLTNLRPDDPAILQTTRRTLIQDSSGRYWLQSANGLRITPSGLYDFVTFPDGTIQVARPNPNQEYSTHLGLSNGEEVNFAGTIRFGNNSGSMRGTIIEWDNSSGHYRPPISLIDNANLPSNLFTGGF